VRWAAPLGFGPDLLRVALAAMTALVVLWALSWTGPIVSTGLALVAFGVACAMLGLLPVDEIRQRLVGWRVARRERVAL